MATTIKPVVSKEDTFDLLEIRLGRVISVEVETSVPKPSYKMKVDFGKFGIKSSIGRFTCHSVDEIKDSLVLGVLNIGDHELAPGVVSEVLILGVQYPKKDSGEATFITPSTSAKIGGKLF